MKVGPGIRRSSRLLSISVIWIDTCIGVRRVSKLRPGLRG